MKNYKEKFIWWIISWLWITLVIWISWIAYWAYVAISSDVNPWDSLSASLFNNVLENQRVLKSDYETLISTVSWLSNVPAWAVMAFNLSSCPTWWISANWWNGTPDLRGEFVRWWDNGRWVDAWRAIWTLQRWSLVMNAVNSTETRLFSLSHENDNRLWYDPAMTDPTKPYFRWQITTATYPTWTTNWAIDANYVQMTRPRNVALLYCVKQ